MTLTNVRDLEKKRHPPLQILQLPNHQHRTKRWIFQPSSAPSTKRLVKAATRKQGSNTGPPSAKRTTVTSTTPNYMVLMVVSASIMLSNKLWPAKFHPTIISLSRIQLDRQLRTMGGPKHNIKHKPQYLLMFHHSSNNNSNKISSSNLIHPISKFNTQQDQIILIHLAVSTPIKLSKLEPQIPPIPVPRSLISLQ